MLTHLRCVGGIVVAVDVGVAEDEFFAKGIAHVGYVKLAFLLAESGVKQDVEQHIAQFFAYVVGLSSYQCLGKFHSFLYGVGANTLIGLCRIPRTLFPERVHHVEQLAERL